MFDTSLINSEKKWPSFIRYSPATKQKKIEKAFSKIGLNDGSANTNLSAHIWQPTKKVKGKIKKKAGIVNVKKLSVVFSTHPWDIATMSMRGITSCQRWSADNEYRNRLVGSMVDPYAGIIYVTDGKSASNKGKRMFARAVVRLVANKVGKPSLFIERIYLNPKLRYTTQFFQCARIEFESFIRERVPKDIPITPGVGGYAIPISPAVRKLSNAHHSYRDSGIAYTINSKEFVKHLKKIEKTLKDA